MARKIKTTDSFSILKIVAVVAIVLVMSFAYLYFANRVTINTQNPIINKENDLKKVDENKVCMSLSEYEKLKYKQTTEPTTPSKAQERDYRVLNDQLYPPLNRTDTVTQQMLEKNIDSRNMYVPTNDKMDNYRLIGYLVNKDQEKDAGGNNWKLFARQKDRNTSDFYMIPANNNYDVKIHITDDMVKGDRLRDVYSVPNNINFSSPMLNTSSYEYVEIPKADLSSTSRYM